MNLTNVEYMVMALLWGFVALVVVISITAVVSSKTIRTLSWKRRVLIFVMSSMALLLLLVIGFTIIVLLTQTGL